MAYIGLDLSTKTCGIAILDGSGQIIKLDFLSLSEHRTLLARGKAFREAATSLVRRYDVQGFALEAPAQSFGGPTSTDTVNMLLQFNGVAQFILGEQFEEIPLRVVNVSTVRSAVCKRFGWKGVNSGKGQKEKVFSAFQSENLWKFDVNPRKRKDDKTIDEAKDMVDAYVVCLGAITLGLF